MKYLIPEDNMSKMTKKIATFRNKCTKYGCDFVYKEVGEEFKVFTDDSGKKVTLKCIALEIEGKAIVNGWRFIAVLKHTEAGNIIRSCCNIEVPEKYYTGVPVCEHCNTNRPRKDTYIVLNEETGEFKQIGKSCLRDYTNGMDSSVAGLYTSLLETVETFCSCPGSARRYYPTYEVLQYACETVKKFGYKKAEFAGDRGTKELVHDFYCLDHADLRWSLTKIEQEALERQREEKKFNPFNLDNGPLINEALEWIKESTDENNYMHNLKTVCSLEYVDFSSLGLIVSLFPAFSRQKQIVEAVKTQKEQESVSSWIGNVGERIVIDIDKLVCLQSWDVCYDGYHMQTKYMYKIVDTNGNVFIYKTTAFFNPDNPPKQIRATVKAHAEYQSVKQTEIERGRKVA